MSSHNYHPVQTNPFPFKIKLLSLAWKMVNATLYRFSPFFFRGWRRFLVRLFGGTISSTASLNRLAKIDFPWNVRMDNLASINPNSWIYALDKISIGEKSCIGEGVKLLTGTHSLTEPTFDLKTYPISIGPCCWISTSATILPGVTVGEGAVVGACAVVTKDVEPWTVVVGNPARFVKRRELKISQPG